MRVLWILLTLGLAHGKENVQFDSSETPNFSASIECSPTYATTDKIECKFHLKNNDQRDFSVLKWRTPLEGMTSDCLTATCNGKTLHYDGVFMKRSTPGPDHFLPIGAGETLSSTFDVSNAYDMTKAGAYSIRMNSDIEYVVGNVKGMNDNANLGAHTKIVHLSSPAVTFQIVGRRPSKGTLGQIARSLETRNQFGISKGPFEDRNFGKRDQSLTPYVYRGSSYQKSQTKIAHRVAYSHIKSALFDFQNNHERVKTWFGKSHLNVAIDVFKTMGVILERQRISYVIGGRECKDGIYAYTFGGTRKIYLCKLYERAKTYSGFDSKMGILTHELSHALAYTDDVTYGQSACKVLAKEKPDTAVKNADNYEYFVETKQNE